MSRTRSAVVLAVLLGGCLSGAPTVSPTPNTDCPYTLSVGEATDEQVERTASTLSYANLSDARQQEFDRALAGGTHELGDTLPDTWSRPRIVETADERYYAVAFTC